MSLRRRRVLLGLATAVAVLVALPASAFAAGESITVTPSDLQAGGSPTITTTLNFDPSEITTGDSPDTVVTNLPPGLLSNLNANPACLAGDPANDPQQIAGCDIGSVTIGTILTSLGNAPLNATGDLYLEPPAPGSNDVAGIDVHITSPTAQDDYLGVAFNPSVPGGVTLTSANLPNTALGLPIAITSIQTVFNPTMSNGQPFNRLPSSCGDATSTLDVTYHSGATGSGSGSFTPTGCDTLPYSPNLTAAIGVDSSTGGAELKTDVTQAADEAASKAISIKFPSGLTPNAAALAPCVTGTPCTIGTATATSPLMPSTLNGTVTLGGSIAAPTFAITFPAPVNLTINGAVDLVNGAVTFSDVPDVPLTDLSLDITGVGAQRAFITDCKPANVTGTFTGQGGQTHTATAPVTFTGTCPAPPSTGGGGTGGGGTGGGGTGGTGGPGTGTGTGPSSPHGSNPKPKAKPKMSGSVAGLASGHPKLTLKANGGGAKIASVAAGLPRGLKFSRSAIVSHKVCTKKGNKKTCTTTLRVKGLRIVGGSVKTVALKSGRLVITLKKAAARVTITATGPLVTESKSLQTQVKKHKAGMLRFTLKLTTANHVSTSLTMKLKAH